MTGIVEFKMLMYLDCDADEGEVEDALDDFTEQVADMKLKGIHVQSVVVENRTLHQEE